MIKYSICLGMPHDSSKGCFVKKFAPFVLMPQGI